MESGRVLIETEEATSGREQTPSPTRGAPDPDERTLTDKTTFVCLKQSSFEVISLIR